MLISLLKVNARSRCGNVAFSEKAHMESEITWVLKVNGLRKAVTQANRF